MTRTELQDEFGKACSEIQNFVEAANYNGGMGLEARLKLVENRLDDMYWFVNKLIEALPDDENKNEDPAGNVGETK